MTCVTVFAGVALMENERMEVALVTLLFAKKDVYDQFECLLKIKSKRDGYTLVYIERYRIFSEMNNFCNEKRF